MKYEVRVTARLDREDESGDDMEVRRALTMAWRWDGDTKLWTEMPKRGPRHPLAALGAHDQFKDTMEIGPIERALVWAEGSARYYESSANDFDRAADKHKLRGIQRQALKTLADTRREAVEDMIAAAHELKLILANLRAIHARAEDATAVEAS